MRATSETFISPTQEYSEKYNGITVRFEVKGGTIEALEKIGVLEGSILVNENYGKLPKVEKWWIYNSVYFKGENSQVNIGLRMGRALEIFNENMIKFEKIRGIDK